MLYSTRWLYFKEELILMISVTVYYMICEYCQRPITGLKYIIHDIYSNCEEENKRVRVCLDCSKDMGINISYELHSRH